MALIIAIISAGAWLALSALEHQLPGQTDNTTTRDLNGMVIERPTDTLTGDGHKTPLAKATGVPAGAPDLGPGGLSVPAIGMHRMPVRYMDLAKDWTINPPDNAAWWIAGNRDVSPGLYHHGKGRIVVAAHSSTLPGVVAGNPIMGQPGGDQQVTRQARPGDIVELGDKPMRYRIDHVGSVDRRTVMRTRTVQEAKGLVIMTCDRRLTDTGDWRYNPSPPYTFIITATPIG